MYINIKEAAKMLNCSEYTARKLCRKKIIPAQKKLKQWYILQSEIIKFIEK
jgi:hypothetical protein